jgi:hypothetical protein
LHAASTPPASAVTAPLRRNARRDPRPVRMVDAMSSGFIVSGIRHLAERRVFVRHECGDDALYNLLAWRDVGRKADIATRIADGGVRDSPTGGTRAPSAGDQRIIDSLYDEMSLHAQQRMRIALEVVCAGSEMHREVDALAGKL